jgi:hypothetical protein
VLRLNASPLELLFRGRSDNSQHLLTPSFADKNTLPKFGVPADTFLATPTLATPTAPKTALR